MHEHRLTTGRRARWFSLGGGADASDLWIVLHGYGQLASGFLRQFTSIAAPSRLVVAPEALNRFYVREGTAGSRADARVGATWMTTEDRESEIADYVDFLDAVASRVAASARRITVLGFSQGVATAVRWLSSGRARADRLVLWAGQVPPDADLDPLRGTLGSAVLVEGTADEHAAWIHEGRPAERFAAAGVPVELLTFDGGHRLDDRLLARLASD